MTCRRGRQFSNYAGSAVHVEPTTVAVVLGTIGAAIGVVTILPQVHRLWVRREHAGLSLHSTTLTFITSLAWLSYAVAVDRLVQIAGAVVGAVLCGTTLAGLVVLARPRRRAWLPLSAAGVSAAVAAVSLHGPASGTGFVAMVLSIGSTLPQIASLVRGHLKGDLDIRGLAQSRWAMGWLCNMVWLSYALLVHDPVIRRTAITMGSLSLCVLVLARTRRATDRGVPEPNYSSA